MARKLYRKVKSNRVSLRVDNDLFNAMNEVAEELQVDVSVLIRYAVKKHVVEARKGLAKQIVTI